MYRDYEYFEKIATDVVRNEKIRHAKVQSGIWKGDYETELDFPQFRTLDEKHSTRKKYYNYDYDAIKHYKIKKYGANFSNSCRYGHENDIEKGKLRLIQCIAQDIREYWRKNYPHPISEFYDYLLKGGEAKHEGEQLVIEYFKIIIGKINESNWRQYTFNKGTGIGQIINFKELYYAIKEQAKTQWQSYNNHYKKDTHLAKPLTSYVFDEQNIYAIADFEANLNKSEKPSELIKPEIDQSKNTGFIKVGYRPEFLTTPILYGRERVLILANGEKHRAQYAIVELENILASHNEYSFTDTENYPVNARNENINDRNYSGDINAQAKVIDIAQNFEPETQISTSATAAGLPVITIDGIVVSGNNRTMSFKRMVKDFPEKYNEYLKTLQGEIVSFGFTQQVGTALIMKDSIPLSGSSYNEPLSVKFEQPILVRIDYDFPAYNTTEMNKYNKDTKKAERPIDRAIKLSSMLLDNEKAINIISDILLPYETLSDFYSNVADVKRLKQALIDNNILTAQETPNYFTDVNTLTVNGKEFLLNLLAGMILDKDALISSEMEGVKRLKEKLVAALPLVIKNSKLPEGSLKNEINQAIVLQQQMVAVGMNISDYIRSPKLFDTGENFSAKAYYINELLNGTKYAFKAALESYNKAIISNQGASMFGDQLTADDIFEKTMVAKVDQDIVNIIKSFGKKPEAPIATQINNEKEKARARARAKLKLSKVQTTIMAKGGNIVLPDNLTELQRNTINKIYADWKEKINEKNVQLKNAKNAKSKAQNEIQLRCGLFGDTKADPRQSALFQTELVCNDITFNNSLKPYDLRIRQIEMDIENITENTKKQIYAAMHQTEMALMCQGGNAGCDKGCTVEGKTHENGGEKFRIKETGQIVELEVDEAVIKADAVKSEQTYMFEGKEMTTAAILNKINTDHGGNPIH